jgi:ABC-type protease/lipase transport system fused ATPase/permease subunit
MYMFHHFTICSDYKESSILIEDTYDTIMGSHSVRGLIVMYILAIVLFVMFTNLCNSRSNF